MTQGTLQETPAVLETVASPVEGEKLVPYQPLAPVGSPRALKGLLERNMASLKQILPKHVPAELLVKTLLMAVSRQPELLECTQESLIEGVMRSAELGLNLSGTLGEAYLVPFNTKVSKRGKPDEWRKLATFIPGYRGLAKLARQSGEVGRIEAEPVFEADHFVYEKGTAAKIEFRPAITAPNRGKCLGYYALIMTKDDTQPLVQEWMSLAQVEKIQSQAKSGNSLAWKNHFDEMGRKTVFRRAAKWAPLSGEKYNQAIAADNADFDLDSFDVVETTATALPAVDDMIAGAGQAVTTPSVTALAFLEAEIKGNLPEDHALACLRAHDLIAPAAPGKEQSWRDLKPGTMLEEVQGALAEVE